MQEPAGCFSHQELLLGRVPASLAGRELHSHYCRLCLVKKHGRNHEEAQYGLPRKTPSLCPGTITGMQWYLAASLATEEKKIDCVCPSNPQFSMYITVFIASEMSSHLCQHQETPQSAHRPKPCFVRVGCYARIPATCLHIQIPITAAHTSLKVRSWHLHAYTTSALNCCSWHQKSNPRSAHCGRLICQLERLFRIT